MRSDLAERTARSLPVWLALAVCACSSTTAEQANQQAKAAAAASATAQLAASEWVRGAVPQHYALRTVAAARLRIGDAERQIEELASSDATARLEAAKLKPIVDILAGLQSAMQKRDRTAAERAVGDLQPRQVDLMHSLGGA